MYCICLIWYNCLVSFSHSVYSDNILQNPIISKQNYNKLFEDDTDNSMHGLQSTESIQQLRGCPIMTPLLKLLLVCAVST